jgi:hypothetical protein
MSDVPGGQPGGSYGQSIPPMTPPPPPGGGGDIAAARRKVQAPAIVLIVLSIVGLVFGVLGIVLQLAGISLNAMFGQEQDPVTSMIGATGVMVGEFVRLVFTAVVLLGAMKMKSLQGYTLAMIAAILAIFPAPPAAADWDLSGSGRWSSCSTRTSRPRSS